eukprot:scaffold1404_cov166-Amphora_coffeaeformis.AAC.27
MQALVESITKGLKARVGPEKDVIGIDFVPQGCRWLMSLNPNSNGAGDNYCIEVVCKANEINGVLNYVIDTLMLPTGELDPNPLAPPKKGYREAKAAFDLVVIAARKSVVRLEFPEFPEGCKGRPFREVYQLNARLKSGSFATVCRGTHRSTGRKVAIKCVLRKDLPPSDDAAIYDEVAILASLNHPHITPLIDFFDEKDCYFIVMELMSGGDLFDRIGEKKSYSEADARDLIVKMLKAVAYCHVRKIAHCDMKPKNLLLMSDDNDSFIKLADFGFAARVHEPKSLTKQCGTPFFVAPEILLRKGYDQQSDMWSVGCIIYLLLSGNLPFMGRSQKELFRKIVAGKFEFEAKDWDGVSDDAKDLVRRLLVLDPDQRMTAAEAVRHRWLKASRDRLSLVNLQSTSQRLKTFNARMKLRTAMIAVDWVSSLKRISFTNRNNGGSLASGSTGSGSTRKLLAAAKARRDAQEKEATNGGDKTLAATKALKAMSIKGK